MRFIVVLLLLLAAPALAQTPEQEKKAAETRARVDGAAGGTGNPVAKGEGKREAIKGKTNRRHLSGSIKAPRQHDENSSDREQGRGAR